jgi:O-antigen/teichoic acid export membrane protein
MSSLVVFADTLIDSERPGAFTLTYSPMNLSPRQLAANVARFGSGEFIARLFSITTIVLLGHLYGVTILGVYGLAITVTTYLVPVIDFGLKHVGARLMARFPTSASDIISRVQRRRYLMAAAALPFVLLYAAIANLPLPLKLFLLAFSAIGILYAFSLDWAAWGSENLLFASWVKAIIPACLLAAILIAWRFGNLLLCLVLANLIGYILQAVVFRLWSRHHRRRIAQPEQGIADIAEAMAWRRTSIMGFAWLVNLAFNTVDMLMLGVLSNPQQVGLYSASYRVLNQVLIAYYMLTGVLYPQFARQDPAQRRSMLRFRIFFGLFCVGCMLALPVILLRRSVLTIAFGHPFLAAAPLLLILACCIPLDFLTSYLSNAYLAWNMERNVLICAILAAGTDVALNLYGIPRYGAMAAAVNTVISYVIYLGMLALSSREILQEVPTASKA